MGVKPGQSSRLIAALLVGVSVSAYAAPPDAGRVLQEQQSTTPHTIERAPSNETPNAQPTPVDTSGAKVVVRSFRFRGWEGLATEAELNALVKDAIGRELGFIELEQVADRITKYLKSRGWVLARAYLPQQDVTEGRIEIAVLRGHIEGGIDGSGLQIEGVSTRLHEQIVRRTLAQAFASTDADALRSRDLERGLLLLDDLPGVSARASLERGDAPDTTRIKVYLSEVPLMTGIASMDDYGNRYTGTARANGQLALNDPLRIGDQGVLAVTVAERLKLGRVSYSLPVGYSGLRANVGYIGLRYKIGEELSSLDAAGTAQTVSVGLMYPFLRSRVFNIWGDIDYDYKALKDEALGSVAHDKRIGDWTLSMRGDSLDSLWGGGLSNFLLGITYGDLDLSRVAADADVDALTVRTQGDFTRFNYSLARLQRVTERTSLFVAWNGQRASKNLDSAEEIMLGGPGGIRVYPVGEGSGAEGWLANVELRYDVPRISIGNLQLVSFLDTGRITLDKHPWGPEPNADNTNDYRLTGAGVGVNFSNANRYTVRAAWGTTVGGNPGRSLQGENADGRRDGSRFWLQALYSF